MKVVLFEDKSVEQLYPVTVARAAYQISCAGYSLLDLFSGEKRQLYGLVRPYIEPTGKLEVLQRGIKMSFQAPRITNPAELILLVNARMVPAVSSFEFLEQIVRENSPVVLTYEGQVAAAILTGEMVRKISWQERQSIQASLFALTVPQKGFPGPLFQHLHELIQYHLKYFDENLAYRLKQGNYREVKDGLFVSGSPSLGEYMVVNSDNGPILVDDGASIGPYCYLCGPVYVGKKARIIEHAAIKDRVALGFTTKTGGEVEGSTIEPFTNKQHHGFLGHSYVGSWVNLGAGTCNSDLKNTYGNVTMDYIDERVSTDMQFLGCVIGDYAKSAINTSIFTGKIIGSCSMLYGFITRNVPSFVNYARAFGQVTEVSLEALTATQARMFARRNIEQKPEHIQLLSDIYEQTKHERLMANEPLQL